MELLGHWSDITPHPISALKHAHEQYHHAVQFIAMVGNCFLPQQDDDSQTNMEWWPDLQAFAGRRIQASRSFRLVLETQDFRLACYEDARHRRETLSLHGLTREDVLNWIKNIIRRKGLNTEKLTYITHYQIPDHPLQHGAAFDIPTQSAQEVLATYRSNAELIISQYAAKFRTSSPIRIWPHHFDTGSFIPLAKAEAAVTHAIGIGMNAPDTNVDEHYFYVNHFLTDEKPDYSTQSPFIGLGEWHQGDWKGASLRMSSLARIPTLEEQAREIKVFFDHAIVQSTQFIGRPIDWG